MANEYDWTIMVYMAGDNNLSENMALALNDLDIVSKFVRELEKKEARVNVFAYFDSSSLTAPTHYINFSEVDGNNKPVIKTIKDKNSASANSIKDFAEWCVVDQNKKAANYAMIFSGHSEAFKDTTLMQDEESGNNLSLWRLRWALEEIRDNYLDGQTIDILGFDSCVMSTLEVGYELKNVAKSVVASEGSIPNSGWGYASLLNKIVSSVPKELSPNIRKLADTFVVAFTEYYKSLAIGGRSVDIAAWDLSEIDPLAISVNELAVEFNKHLDVVDRIQEKKLTDEEIAMYQELKKIILQSHFDAQTYMKEQSVDIKDFCKRIIFESRFMLNGNHKIAFDSIIAKCEKVIENVDKCVVKCGYVGEEYQFSNGISIYFPWTLLTYSITNYNYRYLNFIKGAISDNDYENSRGVGKDWRKFLANYLSRVTLRGTRKIISDNPETPDKVAGVEDFSKDNPHWSRDNPHWSRDNPHWSRDNPHWSRDNPHWSRGDVANSLFYFSKLKNFQLSWKISGYADDSEFPKK